MKKNVHYSAPPPIFDPSKLEKDEVIRYVYDENGNLVAMYKENRHNGCLVLILIAVVAGLAYCFW